ncbi:hypothetical protein P153DRAFT_370684 [Dothidotthia symphoricarpi CBS 119687]|uniref:Uncharacterized protein n=1 Tax=Dothidotthia symphoricarpi CBS 119687 TaxID=1392245 RepID=A0A6A6A2G8_9PLEO|nr:uncharacterized protein P153DRAFT_370684 [Dothidotthia symphoricarpi CBS 119687]KAF2124771.1 hypothetical protein P153DRAFT_370684 [Dothidotthia symphoricarpi CBS 119687]
MSKLLILPVPCSPSLISLGQLLTDPLDPTSTSFHAPTERAGEDCTVQTLYHDTISQDEKGRLIPSGRYSWANDVEVNAEQSSRHSLTDPNTAFGDLRHDTTNHYFFHQAAILNKPLYFVTSLQTLTKPTFKPAAAKQESTAETTSLPIHVRRDSAAHDLQDPSKQEIVIAIGLTKVECRVGAANEPHSLDDLHYSWSYHTVDGSDVQLSIGLGKAVGAAEWRDIVGGYYTYLSNHSEGAAGC